MVYHVAFNSLVKDIHSGCGELPCADAALEQEVQFSECATLRLRYSVVGVDDTEEAYSTL